MTHEEMTIHKALAELKVVDSRINKAITMSIFVIANKHSNEKINGKPVSEFKSSMKDNYNKITDLIKRRNAIKRAVVMSNAVTKVAINGIEYTVAEAIDMKNHGMELYESLAYEINSQATIAQRDLEKNSGESLERRAEQYVMSVIQAQPKDSKMSIDSTAMQALRKDYISNNTYDMIDPIYAFDTVSKMRDDISAFNTDVDAALSVSNALTVIEIDY